ncbi:MAG: hypothetical protein U5N10_07350 [Gemmobacter sp.]|nr:hypothetical protein [Gemmobacter sp.]
MKLVHEDGQRKEFDQEVKAPPTEMMGLALSPTASSDQVICPIKITFSEGRLLKLAWALPAE